MLLGSLVTIFFSLLLMGEEAGSVAVGEGCTDPSNCTVANSVCDKVHKKCLLKAEQDCQGNQGNCVFGASCASDLCTCGAGYNKKDDSKLCEPKTTGNVGTACTSGGNQCKTPNSECSSLLACKCKTGFVVNITTGQCDGLVGTACAAGDTCVSSSVCDKVAEKCLLKAGQQCTANEQCISRASCGASGTGVCQCDAGYAQTAEALCAKEAGKENGATPGVTSLFLCFFLTTASIAITILE